MSLPTDFYFSEKPEEFKDSLQGILERISNAVNGQTGEWTPKVIGASTEGAGTYTTQVGYYSLLNNVVDLWFHVKWTAHTGTGLIRILTPFISQRTESGIYLGSCQSVGSFTFNAGRTYLNTKAGSGNNQISIVASGTAVTSIGLSIAAAGDFVGTIRIPIQLDQFS